MYIYRSWLVLPTLLIRCFKCFQVRFFQEKWLLQDVSGSERRTPLLAIAVSNQMVLLLINDSNIMAHTYQCIIIAYMLLLY